MVQAQEVVVVGFISAVAEGDPWDGLALAAFAEGLAVGGWVVDRNVRIVLRHPSGNEQAAREIAAELVGLEPDAIFAVTTPPTQALKALTATIPVVFANVSDPVGEGLVASFARPGGNLTGFINNPDGLGGKWLELLCKAVPGIGRVAMCINPTTAPGGGGFYRASFEAAAERLGVQAEMLEVHAPAEIAAAIAAYGERAGGGLVFPNDIFTYVHREVVVAEVERWRIPAIYYNPDFVSAGGLMSYGRTVEEEFPYRRAGEYVARILSGADPAEMPVQAPDRFLLTVNLEAAQVQGFVIAPDILAVADRFIE